MLRIRHGLLGALCACALAAPAAARDFLHVQTDKPSYRLGETLWFKVHAPPGSVDRPLTVDLLDAAGVSLGARGYRKASEAQGRFDLAAERRGGRYKLIARRGGLVLHAAPIEVYAIARPPLRLKLTVIGENHEPGETLRASLRVADDQGRPVSGLEGRFLASFTGLERRGALPRTDERGWSRVELTVPKGARFDGELSVGVEGSSGMAVTSTPIPLIFPVARVDVFPEGGAIPIGEPYRCGLLVRDVMGRPVAAEGQLEDENGRRHGYFKADHRGMARLEVPNTKGVRYRFRITRPAADDRQVFEAPAQTGHLWGLAVDQTGDSVQAIVSGAPISDGQVLLLGPKLERLAEVAYSQDKTSRGVVTLLGDAPEAFTAATALLVVNKRVVARRPVILGRCWPYELKLGVRRPTIRRSIGTVHGSSLGEPLKPYTPPVLPGALLNVQLNARSGKEPVSGAFALSTYNAGVLEEGRAKRPHLAARYLMHRLADGRHEDVAALFTEKAREARETYLAVRACFPLPVVGVPVDALPAPGSSEGFPGVLGGMSSLAPPKITPPAPLTREALRSHERSPLDELIERASFTREGPPREGGERSMKRRTPPGMKLKARALAARGLPQEEELDWTCLDDRDTIFWLPSLSTSARGGRRLTLPLSHESASFVAEAQGFGRDGEPYVGVGQVRPKDHFHSSFSLPKNLCVGDSFELPVTVRIKDRHYDRLLIRALPPSCLKARGAIEHRVSPKKERSVKVRFRFEVVAPAKDARFSIAVSRIKPESKRKVQPARLAHYYRELTTRSLSARAPGWEQSIGRSGFSGELQEAELLVPEDALPGTVRAQLRVTPNSWAQTVESLGSLLRMPHGCFEQTTAANFPNLALLERFQQVRNDALLARAVTLADAGFERLRRFQSADGGFGMHPGNAGALRTTALGIAQLAAYAKLFKGKGLVELRRALSWVEARKVSSSALDLFIAEQLGEAGIPYAHRDRALRARVTTNYERALLAVCLSQEQGSPEREDRFRALVRALDRALKKHDRIPSAGRGIMGTSDEDLAMETTALALMAFERAERPASARRCARYLRSKGRQGWWGNTRTTVLVLRSLLVTSPALPNRGQALARFDCGPDIRERFSIDCGQIEPLRIDRDCGARPGERLRVRLEIESSKPLAYSFGLRYRVAAPRSSPRAPYRLKVNLPAKVRQGQAVEMKLAITRRAEPARGQVVAAIGIPAGMRLRPRAREEIFAAFGVSDIEWHDGLLTLYWEEPPEAMTAAIPLIASVAGDFQRRPSCIYPYYESGREAFAPGKRCQIVGRSRGRGSRRERAARR